MTPELKPRSRSLPKGAGARMSINEMRADSVLPENAINVCWYDGQVFFDLAPVAPKTNSTPAATKPVKSAERKSHSDPRLDAAKARGAALEKENAQIKGAIEHREQMANLHGEQTRLQAELDKLEKRLANKGKGLVHAIGRKCGFSMERPKDKPAEPLKGFASKIKRGGVIKNPLKKKPKGLPEETGLNKRVPKSSK